MNGIFEMFLFAGDISQSLFDTFPVWRRVVYTVVTHFKFDIMIATVIGLNVFFMAIEYYKMPPVRIYLVFIFNVCTSTVKARHPEA